MQQVAIVADTTGYLTPELVQSRGIQLVSLYVNWEDSSERESDMPNFDSFYDRLRTTERLPTTSQPSIGDFIEVYEPLVDQGLDVVSIHISGGISGTVESARQAKEQLAERKGGPGHRRRLRERGRRDGPGDVGGRARRAGRRVERRRSWSARARHARS